MIKPLNKENLPTYNAEFLNPESIVICRFIESHKEFQAGKVYALPFAKVKELQAQGLCYFVEKVGGENGNSEKQS